jgi:hypothetical protein
LAEHLIRGGMAPSLIRVHDETPTAIPGFSVTRCARASTARPTGPVASSAPSASTYAVWRMWTSSRTSFFRSTSRIDDASSSRL